MLHRELLTGICVVLWTTKAAPMSSLFEAMVCPPVVEDVSLSKMNLRASLLMLSSEAGVITNGHSASKVKQLNITSTTIECFFTIK